MSAPGADMAILIPQRMTERPCGSCTLCCKLVPVATIEKPADSWCPNCDKKRGCRIYEQRPKDCHDWSCLWRLDADHPEGLQPKRTHCVFDILIDYVNAEGKKPVFQLWCDLDYPLAWRAPRILDEIDRLYQVYGAPTLVRLGKRGILVLPPSLTGGPPQFIEADLSLREELQRQWENDQ